MGHYLKALDSVSYIFFYAHRSSMHSFLSCIMVCHYLKQEEQQFISILLQVKNKSIIVGSFVDFDDKTSKILHIEKFCAHLLFYLMRDYDWLKQYPVTLIFS